MVLTLIILFIYYFYPCLWVYPHPNAFSPKRYLQRQGPPAVEGGFTTKVPPPSVPPCFLSHPAVGIYNYPPPVRSTNPPDRSPPQKEPGNNFGGIELGDVPYSIKFKTTEPSNMLELRMCELKEFLPQASDSTKRIFEHLLGDVEKQGQRLAEAIQQKRAITEILRAISDSPSD